MNALILNGAHPGDVELDAVHRALASDLELRGHQVRSFVLRDHTIAPCRGCFRCWVRTPGTCRTADVAREVASSFVTSDTAFFLTPVTFGGYSSELKKALDRMICVVSPFFTRIAGETHHGKRYDSYPRLVVVGMMPGPHEEEELVFHNLVLRNALNMHAPWYTCRVLYRFQEPAEIATALGRALADLEVVA